MKTDLLKSNLEQNCHNMIRKRGNPPTHPISSNYGIRRRTVSHAVGMCVSKDACMKLADLGIRQLECQLLFSPLTSWSLGQVIFSLCLTFIICKMGEIWHLPHTVLVRTKYYFTVTIITKFRRMLCCCLQSQTITLTSKCEYILHIQSYPSGYYFLFFSFFLNRISM